jgi:replicative DNA helicase
MNMPTTEPLLPEQSLPCDIETEKSVLGSIFLSAVTIAQAATLLHPNDFYLSGHRKLFTSMLEMYATGKPIDFTTIQSHMGSEIAAAGGLPYVASLTDGRLKCSNIDEYCRIVKTKARSRALFHACAAAQGQIVSGSADPDECSARLYEQLLAIESDNKENPIESVTLFAERWFGNGSHRGDSMTVGQRTSSESGEWSNQALRRSITEVR